jgi:predicted nucleic acid-binding protein
VWTVVLLDRWQHGEVLLIAPDLLLLEFASLLSKRRRRKQFTTDEARRAFRLMNYFSPELHDTGALLPVALDLSLSTQLSLWDCSYLTSPSLSKTTMITAD